MLPGYVDIHVWSNTGYDSYKREPDQISVALCLCNKADEMALVLWNSHLVALEEEIKREK